MNKNILFILIYKWSYIYSTQGPIKGKILITDIALTVDEASINSFEVKIFGNTSVDEHANQSTISHYELHNQK